MIKDMYFDLDRSKYFVPTIVGTQKIMKRKDIKELHNKEFGELHKMAEDLKAKIGDFTLSMSLGKEKNVAFKKEIKRDLARVMSIMHGKRLLMPKVVKEESNKVTLRP